MLVLVFLGLLVSSSVLAQFQDNITVVASRLPMSPLRRVLVWETEELKAMPLRDWTDVLRLAAGVGLSRRGAFGIQQDASFAGAPFEGVLVLVNGVPVNDPQTGHFHLDVPLPIEAIKRVEVLTGAASPLFGSAAVGGVVAITTRESAKPEIRLTMGSSSFSGSSLAFEVAPSWLLVAERKESRGFRSDSDFHSSRVALVGAQKLADWELTTSLTFGGQQFGAWTFYSARFPHQRERTTVGLFTLEARRQLVAGQELVLRWGARQHRDVYLLDKTRPNWYRNRHRTRLANFSAAWQGGNGSLSWVLGVDGERQLLSSSRLGRHDRNRAGLFAEVGASLGAWSFHLQGRQDWYPNASRFTPGVAVTYLWASGVRWSLGTSSAFRVPSFTELYYQSPASVGNPHLKPEKAWTGETYLAGPWFGGTWQVGMFRRWARDLVDWVRDDVGVFVAQNHAKAVTTGTTADFSWSLGLSSWRASLSYLRSSVAVDSTRSAYALTHPRWEASLFAAFPLGEGRLSPALNYRKPQGRGGFFLTDAVLTWPVAPRWAVAVEVFNLFDRSFQDVPGVPQPGRWWLASLRWNS